jgi:hypothetical protein
MSSLPPPPPGYGGPPPYGMPPTGYQPFGAGRGREHPQGTTVLVLGILSLVLCSILGPVAWVMGNNAIREMDADPLAVWSNRSNITAGRICGIISSVLLMIGVAIGIIAIAVAVGSS